MNRLLILLAACLVRYVADKKLTDKQLNSLEKDVRKAILALDVLDDAIKN